MGKSERMSMGLAHLCLRSYVWAFGGVAVGKSQQMSMERIYLYLGQREWAFGGLRGQKLTDAHTGSNILRTKIISSGNGEWMRRPQKGIAADILP